MGKLKKSAPTGSGRVHKENSDFLRKKTNELK
jgi:hypothetical protein